MATRWDWLEIRSGLRRARLDAGIEEQVLADGGVTSLSNIYRIENVAKYPTQRPDLETIDRWLAATSGETVSVFLSRFDGFAQERSTQPEELSPPVTAVVDTTGSSTTPGESSHGSAAAGTPVPPTSVVLTQLAHAVMLAAKAARRDEALRRNDADADRRRRGPA